MPSNRAPNSASTAGSGTARTLTITSSESFPELITKQPPLLCWLAGVSLQRASTSAEALPCARHAGMLARILSPAATGTPPPMTELRPRPASA